MIEVHAFATPNSLRVPIALEELGLAYDLIPNIRKRTVDNWEALRSAGTATIGRKRPWFNKALIVLIFGLRIMPRRTAEQHALLRPVHRILTLSNFRRVTEIGCTVADERTEGINEVRLAPALRSKPSPSHAAPRQSNYLYEAA